MSGRAVGCGCVFGMGEGYATGCWIRKRRGAVNSKGLNNANGWERERLSDSSTFWQAWDFRNWWHFRNSGNLGVSRPRGPGRAIRLVAACRRDHSSSDSVQGDIIPQRFGPRAPICGQSSKSLAIYWRRTGTFLVPHFTVVYHGTRARAQAEGSPAHSRLIQRRRHMLTPESHSIAYATVLSYLCPYSAYCAWRRIQSNITL